MGHFKLLIGFLLRSSDESSCACSHRTPRTELTYFQRCYGRNRQRWARVHQPKPGNERKPVVSIFRRFTTAEQLPFTISVQQAAAGLRQSSQKFRARWHKARKIRDAATHPIGLSESSSAKWWMFKGASVQRPARIHNDIRKTARVCASRLCWAHGSVGCAACAVGVLRADRPLLPVAVQPRALRRRRRTVGAASLLS